MGGCDAEVSGEDLGRIKLKQYGTTESAGQICGIDPGVEPTVADPPGGPDNEIVWVTRRPAAPNFLPNRRRLSSCTRWGSQYGSGIIAGCAWTVECKCA